MSEKDQLIEKTKVSTQKGISWLIQNDNKIEKIKDLSASYKAPYLYAVTGIRDRASKYANLISNKYLQKDGDFKTSIDKKGWEHIPSSPGNRYVYSNGWIISGLQKSGAYYAVKKGLEFISRFQDPKLGGFYSRFDEKNHKINKNFLDTSSTASAGLAMLNCGKFERAKRAGDFILTVLENQTNKNKFFFNSWETGKGLMTDVFTGEDPGAMRGRKNFCVSTEKDAVYEMVWFIGMPMKFLCDLYEMSLDNRYLDGAKELFSFFNKLDDGKWKNNSGSKIMWGASELYRYTNDLEYKKAAVKILEWLIETQDESGVWVHSLWYKSIAEQPFPATLDLVQEYISEFSDVIFNLSE
jgi:hypothetical protein